MVIKHHMHGWLLLSIIVSILIQVIGIVVLNPIDEYDSKEYLSISGNLFNGKGYAVAGTSFKGFETFKGEIPTRMRQPGYPLYLMLFYWTFRERVIVTQISQVILNVLTIYLLFLISRMTFGHNLWRGTLVALGLYFPLWLTSAFVLTETLFTFVLVLFMYWLLKAMRSKNPDIFKFTLGGSLLGIAVLTKPVALSLALISIVPIVGFIKDFRKALLRYGILLVAFLTILLPWTLRNKLVLGDFTFLSTDGGYNLWYASVGERESKWHSSPEFQFAAQDGYYIDREANNRFFSLAVKHIETDPLSYFVRGINRVVWVWSYFPGSQNLRGVPLVFGLFTAAQILILSFAAIGIFSVDRKTAAYYLLPAVGFSCILLLTKGISRFIVPAMPFFLILSGQGFWWMKLKVSTYLTGNTPVK